MIYHITSRQQWSESQHLSHYHDASLQTEGFIHGSTRDQLIGSANLHFQGQSDLVVLCLDEPRLQAEVRYENLTGGSPVFPHIYGPVNIDAIVEVHDLLPTADGTFQLPSALT